eukprot:11300950-Ditylum_brightwellii.AAC.1
MSHENPKSNIESSIIDNKERPRASSLAEAKFPNHQKKKHPPKKSSNNVKEKPSSPAKISSVTKHKEKCPMAEVVK